VGCGTSLVPFRNTPIAIVNRTRSLPAGLFAFLLLGTLACEAETFGADDPVIDPSELTVVAGVPLAGELITISAPWMGGMADTMSIAIDHGRAVLCYRVEAQMDRFLFLLPADLPPGSHELQLQRRVGDRQPVGRLETGGFTELRLAPGSIFGLTQVIPALPGIVGLSSDAGGDPDAVIIDVRGASRRMVPDSRTLPYGVSASYIPGRFLLYRVWSGGYWRRFGVGLGRTYVDSLAVWGVWWPTHELASGLYLQDQKQQTWFLDPPGRHELISNGGFGHPERIAFSTDGRWAVSSHTRSDDGILIVDRGTRSYRWAPGWIYDTSPLFLNDGTLAAIGIRTGPGGAGYRQVIARMDIATGAITDSVDIVANYSIFNRGWIPFPITLSRSGWIVYATLEQSRLTISFRDPGTLREVARSSTDVASHYCAGGSSYQPIEDTSLDRLYVVGTDCGPGIPIWTFQLP
jgi:hypothetical protein